MAVAAAVVVAVVVTLCGFVADAAWVSHCHQQAGSDIAMRHAKPNASVRQNRSIWKDGQLFP